MIKIYVSDGGFAVKGSFDMGYIGVFRADKIKLGGTVSDIRQWDIADDYRDASDEELAEGLTYYFNSFEEKIQQNIKQVNDNFLAMMYSDMYETDNHFWNIDELTVNEKMPEDTRKIYPDGRDGFHEIMRSFSGRPNDGSEEKPDLEAWLRKSLPMFDLDRLLGGIEPEFLRLRDGTVSFQCSDDVGCEILCGAYDELDEELRFTDWHNF